MGFVENVNKLANGFTPEFIQTLTDALAVKSMTVNVSELPAGSVPTAVWNSTNSVLSLGIPTGATGNTGLSAYESAVANGYVGTVTDWLLSLVGPQGQQGITGPQGSSGYTPIKGVDYFDGINGIDGKSITSVTSSKLNGVTTVTINGTFTGAPYVFSVNDGSQGVQGIQGPKGDTGLTGPQGVAGYTPIKNIDYFDGATGPQGPQGTQGIQGPQGVAGTNGTNGINGIDGTSITSVTTSKIGKDTTVTVDGTFTGAPYVFHILDGSDGVGSGSGDMLSTNNLSDLTNIATARTNLDVYSKGEVDALTPAVTWSNITGKPTFSTVATSGSYTDLINTPTIPTVPTTISSFTNDSGYLSSVAWNIITGVPSTFTPSAHTHTVANITDFPSSLPASDVYAWAKSATKPSYAYSEISGTPTLFSGSYTDLTNRPTIPTVPTNVSAFTNDSGYVTSAYHDSTKSDTTHTHSGVYEPVITTGTTAQYIRGDKSLATMPTTLPASDVYAWAKASTKPTYTASEVGLGNVSNIAQVTSVTASGALSSSGGTTPAITHSTVDGYLHVPATGTTNAGKVLTAGATEGSLSWETPTSGTGGISSFASIWKFS